MMPVLTSRRSLQSKRNLVAITGTAVAPLVMAVTAHSQTDAARGLETWAVMVEPLAVTTTAPR